MDNQIKSDLNVTNIKTIRENLIQKEKNIKEQENDIQSIVFTRMYERRMNRKVWKCSYYGWNINLTHYYISYKKYF